MTEASAIMMTDIIGFTDLGRKGEQFIREIGQKHRAVLQETIACHGGRVINIFGDTSLSIFSSAVEAVRCSIGIQQRCHTDPVIPLRIALHYGEVIHEGGEVYGDAINLTSRMIKMAIQGSVLVSDTMERFIRDEPGLRTRSLGIHQLKYVERSVEIFGISRDDLVLPEVPDRESEELFPNNSVAVLPFVSPGNDRASESLGEVIGESIIHALTKFRDIYVTARSSSFLFKDSGKEVRELGRMLGVAHILEGSVMKQGTRIRVTARLINARTGFHVFSETFERELLDLFCIQEELSLLIAQRLRQEIQYDEKQHLFLPRTSNLHALDLYMQARSSMSRPGYEEIMKAIDLFRRSAQADPDFVLPYAGTCLCYTVLGALRLMDQEQSNQKAGEYARKAMEIDPDLPEAMVVHALSSFWASNWNLRNTDQVIDRALRVAPGSAEIRLFHGMFTLMSGNPKGALIEILLANKLDPLNPNILSRLGYTYLCLKEFDEAHACFRLAHNTAPFAMYIQYILAWSYLLQKQYDQAESMLSEVDEEKDVYQSVPGTSGFLFARQGRLEEAYGRITHIGQLVEEQKIRFPHYNLALVYAGLNRSDEMFFHLERAFSEKPVHLMFFQADPFWEEYREDRRYHQLVNRVFNRSTISEKIVLKSDTREELPVWIDQLLFVAAEDNYCRIVWKEGNSRKEKLLRATIGELEKQLSGSGITRCHRSYLVNPSKYHIKGDSRGFRLVSAFDPCQVPVSRSRSREMIRRMEPGP